MKLPPFVSRLAARLAFLASLLFALGSWPSAVLTASATSPASLDDRDDGDQGDEDVALHRQGTSAERKAQEAARPPTESRRAPSVPRAVPFVPAQSVTQSPPYPPFDSPFRLLC